MTKVFLRQELFVGMIELGIYTSARCGTSQSSLACTCSVILYVNAVIHHIERMPSASEIPPRIIWKDASDAIGPVPIAGAAGGILPGGGLSLTLYSERLSLPEEVELHQQEGEFDTSFREVPVQPSSVLTRTNHAHIILTPSVARQIAQWLMERAQSAEQSLPID